MDLCLPSYLPSALSPCGFSILDTRRLFLSSESSKVGGTVHIQHVHTLSRRRRRRRRRREGKEAKKNKAEIRRTTRKQSRNEWNTNRRRRRERKSRPCVCGDDDDGHGCGGGVCVQLGRTWQLAVAIAAIAYALRLVVVFSLLPHRAELLGDVGVSCRCNLRAYTDKSFTLRLLETCPELFTLGRSFSSSPSFFILQLK